MFARLSASFSFSLMAAKSALEPLLWLAGALHARGDFPARREPSEGRTSRNDELGEKKSNVIAVRPAMFGGVERWGAERAGLAGWMG